MLQRLEVSGPFPGARSGADHAVVVAGACSASAGAPGPARPYGGRRPLSLPMLAVAAAVLGACSFNQKIADHSFD